MGKKRKYWESWEIVSIGTFAALIRISSFLVSITGGGMNPVAMILKNLIATSLLVILLYRVRKYGVLSLYVLINSIMTMVMMGRGMMMAPCALLAGLIGDWLIVMLGGYRSTAAVLVGVGFYETVYRIVSLGLGYFFMRENINLLYFAVVTVSIGYIGCIAGIFTGMHFSRELKHAGIIRL